ncbi:MAG: hypothetical protein QE509_12970 [Gammaproteobacteria bacterium]|nr:hypothetical protein [Gammaproteobacteria bacterium]
MRIWPSFLVLSAGAWLTASALAAPIVPPSIGAFTNTANRSSPLGSNLTSPTDYTREYPFINHFKTGRPWFSGNTNGTYQDGRTLAKDARGNVTSLLSDQVARSLVFTGTPADPGIANRTWHFYFDGDGDFTFSNVQGTVSRPAANHYVFKTRAIPTGVNRNTIELTVNITMTRNNRANPVKNVRLLPPGGICRTDPTKTVSAATACAVATDFRAFDAHHKTIVFNPSFLSDIKTYRSLRFMDWMKTNNSLTRAFSTRPVPDDQFWNSDDGFNDVNDPNNCNMLTRSCKGVPLEVMFALANLMDMDPWFNIPHMATFTDTTNATSGAVTESYVKQFAKMLKTHLETGRRAYIEYSNEVWNFQFVQSVFADQMAKSCGAAKNELCADVAKDSTNTAADAPDDPGSAFVRFYSKRAQQIFTVFDQVLGAERHARIRRVMASQAANPYFTDQILAWPNNTKRGASKADVFAIAPYFGDTLTDFNDDFTPEDDRLFYKNCGNTLVPSADGLTRRKAFLAAGVEGVIAWLQGNTTNTTATSVPDLGYGSFACVMKLVRTQADAAGFYGVPLTSYEGGQHFLLSPVNFSTTVPDEIALNRLFDRVNRDPRMTSLYTNYLKRWRAASDTTSTNNGLALNLSTVAPNGGMFHHFVNSDGWSPFGRWGAKEYPTQTASPKFKGLQAYITGSPMATLPSR